MYKCGVFDSIIGQSYTGIIVKFPHCKVYSYDYKLSRQGRWKSVTGIDIKYDENRFKEVTICHLFGKPATMEEDSEYLNQRNESGFYFTAFSEKCKEVRRWEYIPNAFGDVAQEVAYTKDGKVAYVCTFNKVPDIEENENDPVISKFTQGDRGSIPALNIPSTPKYKNVSWGIFTDQDGLTLKLNKNGTDRIKISHDADGYEKQHLYYDAHGQPQKNDFGAYGKR